jgi:rubrerythrin
MGIQFNADEVLGIAERIERNGAAFYRGALQRAQTDDQRSLLGGLAEMEEEHLAVFADMRAQLAAKDMEPLVLDPDSEGGEYLMALADATVFDLEKDPSELLAGASQDEILRTALGFERSSIVFYQAIQDVVPASHGRDRVSQIVKEEMWHVVVLSRKLDEITG